MPLEKYGVLKGGAIARRLGFGKSPHYQIHVIDETTDYRISINVKSKIAPSELLYLVDEQFQHPILDELQALKTGFTPLTSEPGGMALDYIRGNLFDRRKMVPLPHNMPGPDNDLNEKIDRFIIRAIGDAEAMVYAFGERWGPEDRKDPYFGFKPYNGIHDIHMNQGNEERFAKDNGVWQDGGLLIHFPVNRQWIAIFLTFQSQAWHTDDRTGHRIEAPVEAEGEAPRPIPEVDAVVRIVAALINPHGSDQGLETVTLLNTAPYRIDLNGWALADKSKRKQSLDGISLEPGGTAMVRLSGKSMQLSNKGGIITLLNAEGLKVTGVSYTRTDARKSGWLVVF